MPAPSLAEPLSPLLDQVTSLVDKSLLRPPGVAAGKQRFMMLETRREYALEQLEASGEGETVRQAMSHLGLKYGHFRFAKTGILDAFFERYLAEGESKGIPFLEWVDKHYDPGSLQSRFRPSFWSDLVVDRIMRRE